MAVKGAKMRKEEKERRKRNSLYAEEGITKPIACACCQDENVHKEHKANTGLVFWLCEECDRLVEGDLRKAKGEFYGKFERKSC